MKKKNKIFIMILIITIILESGMLSLNTFSYGVETTEEVNDLIPYVETTKEESDTKVTEDGVWEYTDKNTWLSKRGIFIKDDELDNDDLLITNCYAYEEEELEIPNEIDGKKVVFIAISNSDFEYAVKKIIIPSNICGLEMRVDNSYMEDLDFDCFENLETIEVSDANNYYMSKDGVLYKKATRGDYSKLESYWELNKDVLVYYPIGKKNKSFELKNGTVVISSGLSFKSNFLNNKYLEKLVISTDENVLISLSNNIDTILINNNARVCITDASENKKTQIICNNDCNISFCIGVTVGDDNEKLKNCISMMYVPEGSNIQKFAEEIGIPFKLLSEYEEENKEQGSSQIDLNKNNYTTLPIKTISNQKYVTGIKLENNTVKEITNAQNFKEGTIVKAYKYGQEITGEEKIGTGTVIKVYENEAEVAEYTAIIYGDTDGDGNMTAVDALAIIKNKTGEVPFTTEAQKEAARVSEGENKEPTAVDALAITMTILGRAVLNQETGLVIVNN